jgi:cyclic pyranopterin phosphate synthase
MAAEGPDWLPGPGLLTDDEVSCLISVAVLRLGVTEVRFTGDPLLRRGLTGLVAAAAALDPRPEISLTTNGIGLARRWTPGRGRAGPAERVPRHPVPRDLKELARYAREDGS